MSILQSAFQAGGRTILPRGLRCAISFFLAAISKAASHRLRILMLIPVRRVVTGHDSNNRSVVLLDGPAETVFGNPDWPTGGVTALWKTDQAPANNRDPHAVPLSVLPTPQGTTFLVSQIPPERETHSMTPAARERLANPPSLPGLFRRDVRRHPGMHFTHSVDYLIVLAGELTMLLDEGEVVLKPFDVVVQRGTNHAWINRGTETVLLASVVVGA